MKPIEKAEEIVWKYYHNIEHAISNEYADKDWEIAKQCALIAVVMIINSNPHSNPFNTTRYSTMDYWQDVKTELEKL
jgi:hypothetical protein